MPVSGGADPHARERGVLDLATVIRIDPEFSTEEQDRARAVAAHDPRLKIALESAGYGLTQTLAAAPQLVAHWKDAQTADPYAWAVLTAALDVIRLGARAPLSIDFLRAAAPGYLTSQQQAEAPKKWFKQALTYATRKLYGAVAALSPVGEGMRQVAGYIVADYLIQHASQQRRYERVPASMWDAVLSHIRDPADAARLAYSARNRLLHRYAIPLCRRAADAGDRFAAVQLAELLAKRGDLDELRAWAEADDDEEMLAAGLAALTDAPDGTEELEETDDLDEIGARARARAAVQALELGLRGDLDELRSRADADDGYAAVKLARLLAERGDLAGLRAQVDAGNPHAGAQLAKLLTDRLKKQGRTEEAEQLRRFGLNPDGSIARGVKGRTG
jgi:hypothetical protein